MYSTYPNIMETSCHCQPIYNFESMRSSGTFCIEGIFVQKHRKVLNISFKKISVDFKGEYESICWKDEIELIGEDFALFRESFSSSRGEDKMLNLSTITGAKGFFNTSESSGSSTNEISHYTLYPLLSFSESKEIKNEIKNFKKGVV